MPVFDDDKLNIISCPSCSRVENEKFVELAEAVKEMTVYAERHALTIAVMGCRVNGPGETDDADLGLWCGPTHVNLKRRTERSGAFTYDEILPRLRRELDALIARAPPPPPALARARLSRGGGRACPRLPCPRRPSGARAP